MGMNPKPDFTGGTLRRCKAVACCRCNTTGFHALLKSVSVKITLNMPGIENRNHPEQVFIAYKNKN
jgi:hypothetical protein